MHAGLLSWLLITAVIFNNLCKKNLNINDVKFLQREFVLNFEGPSVLLRKFIDKRNNRFAFCLLYGLKI